VAIGRWTEPQPPGTTLATLPAPQLGGLRAAAHAQLAAAALAVVDDRVGDAEIRVREVLSVGFLLADQGLTLVDHFMGQSLIRMAGTALESLYRVSGRTEAYEALRLSRQVSAGAAARATGDRPAGAEALVRALPGLVLDPSTVRGVAWESFALLATLGPCLNLNRVVFGPGEAYTDFVEEARQALVRWPSEEPLFQIASRGFLRGESGWGAWLGGALALLLSTEEGSCGHLLRTSRAR